MVSFASSETTVGAHKHAGTKNESFTSYLYFTGLMILKFLPSIPQSGWKVEGGEEKKRKVSENNGQLHFRPPARVVYTSRLDQKKKVGENNGQLCFVCHHVCRT